MAILSGALLLAACASYRPQPQPVDPRAIAATIDSRSLDPEVAEAELARLAPRAQWRGGAWDRLSLFAEALHFNPRIAQARASARTAAAAAQAARVRPGWTLTLTAEYAANAIESSPWLFGAISDVPLDRGGRRSARIESSDLTAEMARYDYLETVWSVRVSLQRALAERLLAVREIELGDGLTELRARQLTAIERRVASGETERGEMERIRADAAGDARRRTDAQFRLDRANAALAEALGLPTSAVVNARVEWNGFDRPFTLNVAALDEMRSKALLARSDVLQAVVNYDRSESDLRGEVARQYPAIQVGPGFTWERGLVKLPFALALVMPPPDLNRHEIAVAEARRAEAARRLESVVAAAQAAIDAARGEALAARVALARIRSDELPAARSLARQADAAMDHGEINRVDWAAAHAGEYLAGLAEIDTLRRVKAADVALEDALRMPLEGPELMLAPGLVLGDRP